VSLSTYLFCPLGHCQRSEDKIAQWDEGFARQWYEDAGCLCMGMVCPNAWIPCFKE